MTGDEIRRARVDLAHLWGIDRPLHAAELARVLGLGGRDPGASILDYERGKSRVSGPVALAVALMLDGAQPRDLAARLRG